MVYLLCSRICIQDVMNGVPRYYDDMYAEIDPIGMEKIKKLRREYQAKNKEEYTFERLLDKHKCKKARMKLREDRHL